MKRLLLLLPQANTNKANQLYLCRRFMLSQAESIICTSSAACRSTPHCPVASAPLHRMLIKLPHEAAQLIFQTNRSSSRNESETGTEIEENQ